MIFCCISQECQICLHFQSSICSKSFASSIGAPHLPGLVKQTTHNTFEWFVSSHVPWKSCHKGWQMTAKVSVAKIVALSLISVSKPTQKSENCWLHLKMMFLILNRNQQNNQTGLSKLIMCATWTKSISLLVPGSWGDSLHVFSNQFFPSKLIWSRNDHRPDGDMFGDHPHTSSKKLFRISFSTVPYSAKVWSTATTHIWFLSKTRFFF